MEGSSESGGQSPEPRDPDMDPPPEFDHHAHVMSLAWNLQASVRTVLYKLSAHCTPSKELLSTTDPLLVDAFGADRQQLRVACAVQYYDLPELATGQTTNVTAGIWVRKTSYHPQHNSVPIVPNHENDKRLRYSRLGPSNIRLLKLKPGRGGYPLTAELCDHPLSDCQGQYEAVSYTWGDGAIGDNPDHVLIVDGPGEFHGVLALTKNLYLVLRRLRLSDRVRTLWVDFVCINQRSTRERSQQVAKMDRIFQRANRVLAWLGPATDDSAVGMELLKRLCKSRPAAGSAMAWNIISSESLLGLENLLTRPFFRRSWILQEASLAREIIMICGDHELRWKNTIAEVLPFIRNVKLGCVLPLGHRLRISRYDEPSRVGLGSAASDNLIELLNMQLMTGPESGTWTKRRLQTDILELMYTSRQRLCANPQDKVYSVRGLVDDATKAKFVVDYKRDVYPRLVEVVLRETFDQCEGFRTAAQAAPHGASQAPDTPFPAQDLVGEPPLSIDSASSSAAADYIDREDGSSALPLSEQYFNALHEQSMAQMKAGNFDAAAELLQAAATMMRSKKFEAA